MKNKLDFHDKYFLSQFIENSPNPIFIVNERGRLIFLNPSCKIFKSYTDSIKNKKYSNLLNQSKNSKKIDLIISKVFEKGEKFSGIHLEYLSKSGKVFHSDSRFYPLFDENKNVIACVVANTDITKQIETENKLFKKQETFRALAESSNDVIMRFDRQYRHIYVNSVVYESTGIHAKDFIGKTHKELGFPENLIKIWERAIEKVFKTAKPNRIEFQLPTKIWIDWLLVPEFSQTGKVQYVIATARDITERKNIIDQIHKLNYELEVKVKERIKQYHQANKELKKEIQSRKKIAQELKERQKQYKAIFESAIEGLVIVNKHGEVVEANPSAYKMYGYKYNEFLKLNLIDLVDSKSKKEYLLTIKPLLKNEDVSFHGVGLKKNGYPLYIEAHARIFSYTGKRHFLITVNDITKRKLSEQKLQDREKNYTALFNLSPIGIVLIDFEGNILDANPAYCNIIGYSREELLKMKVTDLSHPDSVAKIDKHISYLKKNKILRHTVKNVKKDGEVVYLELNESRISLAYGGEFVLAIASDITDQKLAFIELEKNERRYRTLFDMSPSGIMIENVDNIILDINPALCKSLGYKYEEVIGKPVEKFFPQTELESVNNFEGGKNQNKTIHHTIETQRKDGKFVYLELSKTLIPLTNNTEGVLVTGTDITKRIKYEKDLLKAKEEAERSNKLKTEFLAQMSHEIRSPINVILSFTSLLEQEVSEKYNSKELMSYFKSINRGSRRIIKTIDMILNMSEIQTGSYEVSPRKLSLAKDVFKGVLDEYSSLAESKSIKLTFVNKTHSSNIVADLYSVIQIFSNLVDNAIKYTEKGKIEIKLYRNAKNKLCVNVKDSGVGISEKYLPNLFNPFTQEESGYTRKFEGTGLGLALVYQYCQLNNATIFVRSTKGKGSTFKVIFEGNK